MIAPLPNEFGRLRHLGARPVKSVPGTDVLPLLIIDSDSTIATRRSDPPMNRRTNMLTAHSRRSQRVIALLSSCLLTLLASCGAARADRPHSPTLVATIPVSTPRDVTAGFASIWVSNGPSRTVTRINPSTRAISATITGPDPASVLAIGAGSVWLTSYPGNSLTRIDPTTNKVTGTLSLSPGGLDPIGVTVFDCYVWVANHDGNPTGSVAT